MTDTLHEELTDAVFRAALEPDAWTDVMRLMKLRFPSSAQTFYFLHRQPRQVRPVCLTGIDAQWLASFNALYFAPDNPWIRLTERLHRPGVVRTNERLEQLLGDPGVLYRSAYFNDWMRPQGFKYTLGNTLLADDHVVANVTLLRPADMPTFDDEEVRAFDRLSAYLTRSLQMAVRLERAESGLAPTPTFDALPQPVALLDADRRVIYANPAMESLLRSNRGLALRQGVLHASEPRVEQQLTAQVAAAATARTEAELADAGVGSDTSAVAAGALVVHHGTQPPVVLHAVPVTGAIGRYVAAAARVLLVAARTDIERCISCDELRELYGYTRSEARLAQLLVLGKKLKQAASTMGITYATARVYLKLVFEKTGVHSQAELVARVLRDTPGLS